MNDSLLALFVQYQCRQEEPIRPDQDVLPVHRQWWRIGDGVAFRQHLILTPPAEFDTLPPQLRISVRFDSLAADGTSAKRRAGRVRRAIGR